MPVCYVTLSEAYMNVSDDDLTFIRRAVAEGLDSKSRRLDETHIALRLNHGLRKHMLGDIELDIFAQLYLSRLFSRDRRANIISSIISEHLNCGCATWINLMYVGYSRVTEKGIYFSDADNPLIRAVQIIKGVSTREN